MKERPTKALLLAGKGGCGKTTLALMLSLTWEKKGLRIGLLDANLSSPELPFLLGLPPVGIGGLKGDLMPINVTPNLRVLSIGLFLEAPHTPVAWRGPIKHAVLKQMLEKTNWGELDLLVIDLPPGLGEEHLSLVGLLPEDLTYALLVSEPSRLSLIETKRLELFLKKTKARITGFVFNKVKGDSVPRYQMLESPLLSVLPYDRKVARGSMRQGVLLSTEPGLNFRRSLKALSTQLWEFMGIEGKKPLTLQAKVLLKGGH